MPSFADLQTHEQIDAFARKVTAQYAESSTEKVALNGEIKTSKDLIARIDKGLEITCDYRRLMREIAEYTESN